MKYEITVLENALLPLHIYKYVTLDHSLCGSAATKNVSDSENAEKLESMSLKWQAFSWKTEKNIIRTFPDSFPIDPSPWLIQCLLHKNLSHCSVFLVDWSDFLFFFFFEILSIYFFAVLDLYCHKGFPLAAASVGYSLIAVLGLLIAVASRCRAQALGCVGFNGYSTWAAQLWLPGSRHSPNSCGIWA